MTATAAGAMLWYMVVNSFTPGPGNILAMNAGSTLGMRNGWRVVAGVCLGYLAVQMLCTALAVGLSAAAEPLLGVLKYVGAAYIVWLAAHIARSDPGSDESSTGLTFKGGFLLQFVNVKIYFYMMTLLTVYLMPVCASWPLLVAAGVFVVAVGSVANVVWAAAGAALQEFYRAHFHPVNYVLAASLALCVVDILAS